MPNKSFIIEKCIKIKICASFMVTFWVSVNCHLSSVMVVLVLRVGSCLSLALPKCL